MSDNPTFLYDEVDAQVWREELDPFLPPRIFDVHGHVYLKAHVPSQDAARANPSLPVTVPEFPHETYAAVEQTLWPGRDVTALLFGSVDPAVDLDSTNAYVAEAARAHHWHALMVPSMTDDAGTLLAKVHAGGFVGLKPYWTFVTWKKQNDVTIEDMITPAMRDAADRAGLIITTHITRAGRLADPLNIAGLRRLSADCPNAKIVLAHFGRSYFLEAVGDGLSLVDLPNLYPELSMIQDWEVIEAILRTFDRSKILFGLDLPMAQEKGKLISVNGQRHFFTKRAFPWSAHVDPGGYEVRCTLYAYEIARAIKKAAGRAGLTPREIEGIFCTNAERLVASVPS